MTRNKRCALSLRCDGDGEKMSLVVRRRERVCTVFMKRLIRIIPPQTVPEGGARDASRRSHSASARSFRLIRRMSVGVGGLAWARSGRMKGDSTRRSVIRGCHAGSVEGAAGRTGGDGRREEIGRAHV